MIKPQPNKHYWIKNKRGEWTIGQFVVKDEPDAMDTQIEGFVIIGSTLIAPLAWAVDLKGPIEMNTNDTSKIRS